MLRSTRLRAKADSARGNEALLSKLGIMCFFSFMISDEIPGHNALRADVSTYNRRFT